MDEMLREANRIVNKVFRSSESGSEMEDLAMAMQSLIVCIARRDRIDLDENDDE